MTSPFAHVRRNAIRRDDLPLLLTIATFSGIAAALAGCRPTGQAAVDVALTAAMAAITTWLGATASWWSLCAAGTVAAAFVGTLPLAAPAAAAALVGMYLGNARRNIAWARSLAVGSIVQVLLRLHFNPFFGASAIVAGTVLVFLWVVCGTRRRSVVRRRLRLGLYIAAGFTAAALVLFVGRVTMVQADLQDGYQQVLDGLEQLQDGDTVAAAATLHAAAERLQSVGDASGSVWTTPARLVPIAAQHRNAIADIVGRAADTAEAAANALETVDLDALAIEQGIIDVEAIALLEQPLADLHDAVDSLRIALTDADSPWLVGPAADRLDRYRRRAEQATTQAEASAAAARVGPLMLGANERRTYLVGFVSPAEARGAIGMVGNYAVVTIDDGKISRTEFGRANALGNEVAEAAPIPLDLSEQFLARYGSWITDGEGNAGRSVWSNSTMTPDVPSAAAVLAHVWEGTGHPPVDGVFLIDPAGLAALLRATGPVEVEGLAEPLQAASVERFLYLDQYDAEWEERSEMLERVATATLDAVLLGQLPGPQHLARELGPAATGGDLVGWAPRPEEQALLRLIGMDGALPAPDGRDALAVVTNNASANKIDSFLERTIEYDAEVHNGAVRATVTITLHNTAPASGYPSYVLGSEFLAMPSGTNRTLLSVYTPLDREGATLDGQPVGLANHQELGYRVYSTRLDLAPGETRVLKIELRGNVDDEYALVVRPQPMAIADSYTVRVEGDTTIDFSGEIDRRVVIDSHGTRRVS